MKEIICNTKNAQFTKKEIETYKKELNQTLSKMNNTISQKTYETDYASLVLPDDSKYISLIKKCAKEKQKIGVDLIVVVGIGGSNLGTIAILEAIKTPLYNHIMQPQFLFVDTCDSQIIREQKTLVETAIKQKQKVHVISVSKSGGTTETIANTQIFIDILQKNVRKYEQYVTIISDEGSKYHKLAERKNFSYIPLQKKVGGRYSVFSAVGLYPLALAGLNITQLIKGAQSITHTLHKQSMVVESAIVRYLNYTSQKNIHDLFLFAPSLESVGKWYRQLVGESLGKEFSLNGEKIDSGFTPTVSIGSTDLHSVGQLYLGGPNDKYTTFVSIQSAKKVIVPYVKDFEELVSHIQKVPLTHIMDAILLGTQKAYSLKKIPYSHLTIPKINEYLIGQLLQFFMCEIMLVASLTNVNAFDQPNVENYKTHTKQILAKIGDKK